VASLLEVGTGFHPELTGRENVYLSGTILGMRKAEIDRKFDEIVAFSGIEKFLDTPVKRYSSGMYVRLAFGVAAHLEPEVLVVDEVLAVGDAEFQNKCLGKMDEVGKQGRTVLFVSHNMQAMTRLCNRMILLDGGRLVMDGPPEQVVSRYMHSSMGTSAEHAFPADAAPGDDVARLRAVRVRDADGHVSEVVDVRRPVVVELEYEVLQPFPLVPYVQLNNEQGYAAFCSFDTDRTWADRPKPPGTWLSAARIPGNLLSEGTYVVRVGMISYTPFRRFFNVWDAVAFRVIDPMEGGSARGAYVGHIPGVVRPFLEWETTAR
jgi:lipopolysaccharide transport system ATP-binding protein